MTKKILIAGYYGFSNTGDEAILSSMLCDMRSIHPDLEFTVISGNPKETSCRYNVTAILWTDIISMIDAAREADLILLGGGGLFHDYWGIDANNILTRQHVGIPFYSGIPILALLNDKPFMIYSVGVGPLLTEEGKRLTSLSFKIADIATLRDNDSLNLLHAIGVQRKDLKVTADPTFRLRMKIDKGNEILTKIRMEQSGPLVGVCLRNWDFGVKPEIWQQEVAQALDQFVQNYRAVLLFIPFQTLAGSLTDDIAVIKNVTSMIHNKKGIMILEEEYTPEEISGILNGCDIVLGMRLHSILMAINNLVPTIGLEYDPKIGNLMKRMGLNSYLISITSLKSDDLFALLERIWYEKAQIKLQIAQQILKLQEQANENAVLAIDLLEHGRKRQIKPSEFDFIKELVLQKIIQIENKEQAIHSATIQLREKEQSIQSMDAHLIQKDQLIRSLSIQVQDISRENYLLTARLTEQEAKLKVAEHEIHDISGRLEENEINLHNAYNKINALSAKLIESDSTLEQIRSNYEIVRDRLEEIEKSTAW
jgi:polysaccharide pyruvyl transferase CsaB